MRVWIVAIYLSICLGMAHTLMAVESKPTVFVSVLPQKFIVQQISGDMLNVEVMVAPGASPATYEPKPSQMRGLAAADAYFAVGVPFENSWLDKIGGVNPGMRIVHTDEGITKLTMARHLHDGLDLQEYDAEDESDTGLDPHIWLSPPLVKHQARTTTAALQERYPASADFFQERLDAFLARIGALHVDLQQVLGNHEGAEFMVFHPTWGYFARDYGLRQVAIEMEGKQPKPAQLRELIEHARRRNIRIVFAQPQFSAKNARVIAREIGGEVIMIDPLAEDWLANMHRIAQTFSTSLK